MFTFSEERDHSCLLAMYPADIEEMLHFKCFLVMTLIKI